MSLARDQFLLIAVSDAINDIQWFNYVKVDDETINWEKLLQNNVLPNM